jgi:hypothetical protein
VTAAAREVVPASGSMAVGKAVAKKLAVAKELVVELVAETAAVELEVEMAAVAVEAMAAETVQLAFQP